MIELNKIYCGDSLAVMRTWPDAFVQCVAMAEARIRRETATPLLEHEEQ